MVAGDESGEANGVSIDLVPIDEGVRAQVFRRQPSGNAGWRSHLRRLGEGGEFAPYHGRHWVSESCPKCGHSRSLDR